jgi:hypothetical protein
LRVATWYYFFQIILDQILLKQTEFYLAEKKAPPNAGTRKQECIIDAMKSRLEAQTSIGGRTNWFSATGPVNRCLYIYEAKYDKREALWNERYLLVGHQVKSQKSAPELNGPEFGYSLGPSGLLQFGSKC